MVSFVKIRKKLIKVGGFYVAGDMDPTQRKKEKWCLDTLQLHTFTHLCNAFIVYPPWTRCCARCGGCRDEQNSGGHNTLEVNI